MNCSSLKSLFKFIIFIACIEPHIGKIFENGSSYDGLIKESLSYYVRWCIGGKFTNQLLQTDYSKIIIDSYILLNDKLDIILFILNKICSI